MVISKACDGFHDESNSNAQIDTKKKFPQISAKLHASIAPIDCSSKSSAKKKSRKTLLPTTSPMTFCTCFIAAPVEKAAAFPSGSNSHIKLSSPFRNCV